MSRRSTFTANGKREKLNFLLCRLLTLDIYTTSEQEISAVEELGDIWVKFGL